MKLRISEQMDGFFDNDIEMKDAGVVSVDRVRELTMAKLGLADPGPVRRPMRKLGRILLIAATVVMALSAAAVAVYQYGLRDAVMEDVPQQTMGEESMETRNILSLNGFKDSPEYQAYLEWTTWDETWRQENMDLLSESNWYKDQGVDDSYYETDEVYAHIYRAVSREQAEKLDEIMDKYGLTLHTAREPFYTERQLCAMLGIDDLFDERFEVLGDYLFNDGTFKAYACVDLNGEELDVTVFNAVKGSITMISGGIPEDYKEWNYVTDSGVEVVFAANETQAMMIAGLQGSYVTASFTTELLPENTLNRELLESLADGIDLAALAKRFDGSATAEETQKDFEAWLTARESAVTTDNGDETADLVLCILGNYYLTGLPEGTSLYRTSSHVPDEWEDFFSVSHEYEIPTASVTLYYRTLKDGETEVDAGDYIEMGWDITDCTLNGHAGKLASYDGDNYTVLWLDEERELMFRISSSATVFTREEALALAEGVTAADAGMDAAGPEGRAMRIALHQEEIDTYNAALQAEREAIAAEWEIYMAEAEARMGVYTISGLPEGYETGARWTNGIMDFWDWYTGERLGYVEDMYQGYSKENEGFTFSWHRCWDMEDETVSRAAEYYDDIVARAQDYPGEFAEIEIGGRKAFVSVSSYAHPETEYMNEIHLCWLDEGRDRVFNISYNYLEEAFALTLDDLIAMAESVTEA